MALGMRFGDDEKDRGCLDQKGENSKGDKAEKGRC